MRTGENFPVASMMIRPDLRAAVEDFYRFARAADDVADDPGLLAAEKLARLAGFEAGLDADASGAAEGLALRRRLVSIGKFDAIHHARALLAAFRTDAVGTRYRTWDDLLGYCRASADPVGRFLLDLHGERRARYRESDSLCTALQVLNHLQDLRFDHDRLGRIYLPLDWLEAAGGRPEDLSAAAMTPGVRQAVDRVLDRCDELLVVAVGLPDMLRARRLAGETRAVLHVARRLSGRLRRGDSLARRLRPSRVEFAQAGALGLWQAVRPRRSGRLAPRPGRA